MKKNITIVVLIIYLLTTKTGDNRIIKDKYYYSKGCSCSLIHKTFVNGEIQIIYNYECEDKVDTVFYKYHPDSIDDFPSDHIPYFEKHCKKKHNYYNPYEK